MLNRESVVVTVTSFVLDDKDSVVVIVTSSGLDDRDSVVVVVNVKQRERSRYSD